MKWQKVRLLISTDPSRRNLEFWVKTGNPQVERLYSPDRNEEFLGKAYETNLSPESPLMPAVGIETFRLELLARGPEDFADEVEMIPWEVWSNSEWKGC